MCAPMAALAPYLTAASIGFSVVSGLSQAASASAAAKTNANIARTNASIKEKAAADAIQRGADTAAIARQKAKEATGSLRARAGSSGILADTGSNLDIQEQNAGVGELNALTIQNNAEREAYGYKVGAVNDNMQAGSFSQQSKSAMTNGLLSAGATLVTGAANYGSSFGGATSNPALKTYGPFDNSLPWRNQPIGA